MEQTNILSAMTQVQTPVNVGGGHKRSPYFGGKSGSQNAAVSFSDLCGQAQNSVQGFGRGYVHGAGGTETSEIAGGKSGNKSAGTETDFGELIKQMVKRLSKNKSSAQTKQTDGEDEHQSVIDAQSVIDPQSTIDLQSIILGMNAAPGFFSRLPVNESGDGAGAVSIAGKPYITGGKGMDAADSARIFTRTRILSEGNRFAGANISSGANAAGKFGGDAQETGTAQAAPIAEGVTADADIPKNVTETDAGKAGVTAAKYTSEIFGETQSGTIAKSETDRSGADKAQNSSEAEVTGGEIRGAFVKPETEATDHTHFDKPEVNLSSSAETIGDKGLNSKAAPLSVPTSDTVSSAEPSAEPTVESTAPIIFPADEFDAESGTVKQSPQTRQSSAKPADENVQSTQSVESKAAIDTATKTAIDTATKTATDTATKTATDTATKAATNTATNTATEMQSAQITGDKPADVRAADNRRDYGFYRKSDKSQAAGQPAAEAADKSAAEAIAKPATEAVAKSATEATAKPAIEAAAKSARYGYDRLGAINEAIKSAAQNLWAERNPAGSSVENSGGVDGNILASAGGDTGGDTGVNDAGDVSWETIGNSGKNFSNSGKISGGNTGGNSGRNTGDNSGGETAGGSARGVWDKSSSTNVSGYEKSAEPVKRNTAANPAKYAEKSESESETEFAAITSETQPKPGADNAVITIKVSDGDTTAPREFAEGIAESIKVNLSEGKREFDIELEPASLGKISIKLTFERGHASVLVSFAESARVRELLEQGAGAIQSIVEKGSGLRTVVSLAKRGNAQENGDGGQQKDSANSGANGGTDSGAYGGAYDGAGGRREGRHERQDEAGRRWRQINAALSESESFFGRLRFELQKA